MKITNLDFTDAEWALVVLAASRHLREVDTDFAKLTRVKQAAHMLTLTPQNIIRLGYGFKTRQRGGARPNTGSRKADEAAHRK